MSEELKPCPFCGSKDIVLESFGELRHTACCSTCECNTGYMQDDCEAIESWNTRSLEDALRKQLVETIYRAELAEKGFATIEKQDTALRKQLDIAVEALKRYANDQNWNEYTYHDGKYVGGALAKVTLAKIKKAGKHE